MDNERAPSSAVEVENVAPWLILLSGLSVAAMELASLNEASEALLVAWLIGIPVLSATYTVYGFAKGSSGSGWGAFVVGTGFQALVGGIVAGVIAGSPLVSLAAIVVAGVSSTFVYMVASPVLILAYHLSRRTERDRGDTMLLWGSVWSATLHLIFACATWDHLDRIPVWIAITGLCVSLLTIAAGATRAQNRRTFARLALAGKVPGYRVRVQATLAELRELPALYSVPGSQRAVLERVNVSMDGTAYRGGLVATPVALVPIRA